jgi:uncharacterized protein YukE
MAEAPPDWGVELPLMKTTIGTIGTEHTAITEAMNNIKTELDAIGAAWATPSEGSYEEYRQWFTAVAEDLNALLDDAKTRMQQAYDNYEGAEDNNRKNLTASNQPPLHKGGDSGKSDQGTNVGHDASQKDAALEAARRALGGSTAVGSPAATPMSPSSPTIPRDG